MARSADEWVGLTAHANVRWRERTETDDSRIGPRVAWIEGVYVPEPHGLDADEVRYHPPTGVVLLRKGENLVTVIAVAEAEEDQLRQAVRQLGDVADIQGELDA